MIHIAQSPAYPRLSKGILNATIASASKSTAEIIYNWTQAISNREIRHNLMLEKDRRFRCLEKELTFELDVLSSELDEI